MKYADTSWWVAWALPEDRHHVESLRLLDHLGPAETVLTTNLVVGETWTFLRRRDSHRSAVGFLDAVEGLVAGAKLIVHHVDEAQEEAARRWLRRHDERAYSFVDAAGFQVMRDRRLREALAFDGDFSAAGFVELRG